MNVGGYFAELKLVTDGPSFAFGRKQLEEFKKEGEQAVTVFTALQKVYGSFKPNFKAGVVSEGSENLRSVGYMRVGGKPPAKPLELAYQPNAGSSPLDGESNVKDPFVKLRGMYGALTPFVSPPGRYTGGGWSQGGNGNRQNWRWAGYKKVGKKPPRGGKGGGGGRRGNGRGLGPNGPTPIGKNDDEKKRSAIRAIALLYALGKIIQVTEKVVKALWDLTAVSGKQVQQTFMSSARAGMTPEQWKKWQTSFEVSKIDFSAFGSSATALNDAFLKLKTGDASAFASIAPKLAQLGLNPGAMVNESNDQRVKDIFRAAFGMQDKGRARTLLEGILGESAGEMFVRPGVNSVDDIFKIGGGAEKIAVPTKKDLSNAEDFARTEEFLKNFKTLLGMQILDAINPEIKEINAWMADKRNQERIKEAFRGIGLFFKSLVNFLETIGEIFLSFGTALAETYDAVDEAKKKGLDAKAKGDIMGQLEAFGEAWMARLNMPGKVLAGIDQAIAPPAPASSSQSSITVGPVVIQGNADDKAIEELRAKTLRAASEALQKAKAGQAPGAPKVKSPYSR